MARYIYLVSPTAYKTNEWGELPVEFEKYPVELQDFRKITDHFKGIYRIHLKLTKQNRRTSTYDQFNQESSGS